MLGTLRAGEVWRGRLTNRRKDGTLILQACGITPIRDLSGRVSGFVAVSRDIMREVHKPLRAFLPKPYSMREIAAAIRTALDGGTGDPKP